uniref:Uncharacterized protein n=1 Tax=Meloidogyne incognita TaxID=6306 RepID=A0A914N4M6_MELIC
MEDQSNAFTTFGKALSYDANYVPSVLAIASILQMNNDWDVALSKYKLVGSRDRTGRVVRERISITDIFDRDLV